MARVSLTKQLTHARSQIRYMQRALRDIDKAVSVALKQAAAGPKGKTRPVSVVAPGG